MTRILKYTLAALLAASLAGCIVTAPVADEPPNVAATDEQASEPPPPLPDYEQPPCPEPGYIWTPGLWRWGAAGYFWVPGTWVAPPQPGFLWTPGYWALGVAGVYIFHAGYWGPHVGYYGGINYGHGYVGNGYQGGRWVGNTFNYNTAVSNVNVTNIHNTYNETIVNNVNITNNVTRVSYVGAPGSRPAPTRAETNAAHEPHMQPTPPQLEHHTAASNNPQLIAEHNAGHPPIAATPRPSAFNEHGVTAAKPGPAWHAQHPHAEGGHEGQRP
jgi:hypothetical protein